MPAGPKLDTARPSRRTGRPGGAWGVQQPLGERHQLVGRVDRVGQGPLAGGHGEVVMLDLEGHGAPEASAAAVRSATRSAIGASCVQHRLGLGQILLEGPLGADRLVRPIGADLALVLAVGDPM